MTASSYSGGMLVFKGTPTADSLVACGQGAVALRARAGKTYNIMVISDTDVNGGTLVLTLKKPPPPPRVHVSVAGRGVAFRGGAARIHGTYFCKRGEFAGLSGHLFQRAGRLKIQADFGKGIRCNARRHHWSARLVSPVGTYARGHAVKVQIAACGSRVPPGQDGRHIHLAWAQRSHRQRLGSRPPPGWNAHPLVERQSQPGR